LNITAPADDAEDQHVVAFNSVDDDLFAYGKTAQAGTQVLIAATAQVGIGSEKKKTLSDGINHAVGDLDAMAFLGSVIPNVVKVGFTGCGKRARSCHSDPALREKNPGSCKIKQLQRSFVVRQ
jgi:hypothetical protein